MTETKSSKILKVCETCPFLIKNHRKKHHASWYSVANLRRLWNGLRTGDAPGMICHSTDPNSKYYGGKGDIKPGKQSACAGAVILIIGNMNAIAAGEPQPFQPPLTKAAIASYAWLHLTRRAPVAEDRSEDIGLPWKKEIRTDEETD